MSSAEEEASWKEVKRVLGKFQGGETDLHPTFYLSLSFAATWRPTLRALSHPPLTSFSAPVDGTGCSKGGCTPLKTRLGSLRLASPRHREKIRYPGYPLFRSCGHFPIFLTSFRVVPFRCYVTFRLTRISLFFVFPVSISLSIPQNNQSGLQENSFYRRAIFSHISREEGKFFAPRIHKGSVCFNYSEIMSRRKRRGGELAEKPRLI